jgi:hypothetical protein
MHRNRGRQVFHRATVLRLFMLLYRILQQVNTTYPVLVFWGYLGAFVTAFAFVFVFPPIALLCVFAAVLSTPFVFLIRYALIAPQRILARRAIKHGTCPRCGAALVADSSESEIDWRCDACPAHFTALGEDLEILPDGSTGVPEEKEPAAHLAMD